MKENKVVLITGASSGIGAGTALHFAAIGYKNLALVARQTEELEKVAKACRGKGAPKVLTLTKDLSMPEQCQEVIEETVKEFGGRLDVLISNAGILRKGTVRELSFEDFEMAMRVNLTASFLLTKYALPHLEKTKGTIVYNSSVAGKTNMKFRNIMFLFMNVHIRSISCSNAHSRHPPDFSIYGTTLSTTWAGASATTYITPTHPDCYH